MPINSSRGRAHVDPKNPRARGMCQRCGTVYQRNALTADVEYMGVSVQKTGFYVCPTCQDTPNPQLAAVNPPPDPLPLAWPLLPGPGEGYALSSAISGDDNRLFTDEGEAVRNDVGDQVYID